MKSERDINLMIQTSDDLFVSRKDYVELIRRLHEAERKLLEMKSHDENELLESIRKLNPKSVTMEF